MGRARPGPDPGAREGAGDPDLQDVHEGRPDLRLSGQADPLQRPDPAAAGPGRGRLLPSCSPRSSSCNRQSRETGRGRRRTRPSSTRRRSRRGSSPTRAPRAPGSCSTSPSKAVFAAEPRDLSLLHALFYFHAGNGVINLTSTAGGAQDSRFHGGSQLVSIRMAERLGSRVVLNAAVRRISQDRGGVSAADRRRHVAGTAGDRRGRADARGPDRLRAGAAGRSRRPHPARTAGFRDQVRGRVPVAVLARGGPQRLQRTATVLRSTSRMTTRRRAESRACCSGSSSATTRGASTRCGAATRRRSRAGAFARLFGARAARARGS